MHAVPHGGTATILAQVLYAAQRSRLAIVHVSVLLRLEGSNMGWTRKATGTRSTFCRTQ